MVDIDLVPPSFVLEIMNALAVTPGGPTEISHRGMAVLEQHSIDMTALAMAFDGHTLYNMLLDLHMDVGDINFINSKLTARLKII